MTLFGSADRILLVMVLDSPTMFTTTGASCTERLACQDADDVEESAASEMAALNGSPSSTLNGAYLIFPWAHGAGDDSAGIGVGEGVGLETGVGVGTSMSTILEPRSGSSGRNTQGADVTGGCGWLERSTLTRDPDASQTLVVQSSEAVTTSTPLGLHATELTQAE